MLHIRGLYTYQVHDLARINRTKVTQGQILCSEIVALDNVVFGLAAREGAAERTPCFRPLERPVFRWGMMTLRCWMSSSEMLQILHTHRM